MMAYVINKRLVLVLGRIPTAVNIGNSKVYGAMVHKVYPKMVRPAVFVSVKGCYSACIMPGVVVKASRERIFGYHINVYKNAATDAARKIFNK
jgi:hypothetical protein